MQKLILVCAVMLGVVVFASGEASARGHHHHHHHHHHGHHGAWHHGGWHHGYGYGYGYGCGHRWVLGPYGWHWVRRCRWW